MDMEINLIVNECELCQQYKHRQKLEKAGGKLTARFSFDNIAIDITGPLKVTKSHNRHILGICDG